MFTNATVDAKNFILRTGGTAYINQSVYHAAGDPYAKWKTPALTGNGDVDAGTHNAGVVNVGGIEVPSLAAVNDFLGQEPTTPSIKARRILIDSEWVNINGIIQAGEDDYNVILTADVKAQIERLRDSGTTRVTRLDTGGDGFQTYYDPTGNNGKGKVIVTELRPSGGQIDITGNVMNTRNGKIIVYNGYPDIDIVNLMGFADGDAPELVLERIDATTRGEGSLIIKDKAKPKVNGAISATIYTTGENGQITKSVNGAQSTLSGKTDTYTPRDGFRYGWTIVQATRTKDVHEFTEGSWLGIDAFVPDTSNIQPTRTTEYEGEILPDSNYFFLDANGSDPAYVTGDPLYTFQEKVVQTDQDGPRLTAYNSWSTWYGSRYTFRQFTTIKDFSNYYTHTIQADRPIDIQFIGDAEGSIVVKGGNSNVVVDGALENEFGVTSISTTGTIRTTSGGIQGSIGGRQVNLVAGGGIGIARDAVRVDLTVPKAGVGVADHPRLDASTSNGAIFVQQASGDLWVGNVTAGGGRDVALTAGGSILATGSQLVSGGAITLTALSGDIGTAGTQINIDTGGSNRDLLRAYASEGAIHLRETSGDLRLFEVLARDDVSITVVSGNLLDANTNQQRDERAISELRAGVWSDLSLTGSKAAQKVADTKTALATAKTNEYREYWTVRNTQRDAKADELRAAGETDEAVIAATADAYYLEFRTADLADSPLVAFTEAEQAYYEDFYTQQGQADDVAAADLPAYVDGAILALRVARTAQYRGLDTKYAATNGGVFDADYQVTLSAQEIADIDASIKIWTEEELINSIGAGLLKPVTDTEVRLEDTNISGNRITLNVSGAIGRTDGNVIIPITAGGNLTADQRVTLGAAERDDVFYLTSPRYEATVSFQAGANTITRTDGGSWDSGLLGKIIQVEGRSANATEEGPFYTVSAISGNVLTVDAGKLALKASEVGQHVFVSSLALDPLGEAAAATVNLSGNTITRTAGDGLGDFAPGMKLLIKGSKADNNSQSLYTIASVTNDRIVLTGSPFTEAQTGVSVKLDQFVEITAVQVQLREDLDIFAKDVVNVTAGSQSFLGSEAAVAIGQMNVGGNLRIKAQGNLTNTLGAAATNIVSDDLLLEAGQGGIGGNSAAQRIYLDQSATGTLTARGAGGIYLTERAGDMNVNTIYSQSSDVDLVADGSIVDAQDNDFVNIEANDIRLKALNGTIGQAGDALDIEARGDVGTDKGLVTATAKGDITLTEQVGDLNVRTISSQTGSVTLEAALSILDAVDLIDPTNPDSADATPSAAKLGADVLARGDINLTARLGFIGAAGNELDIDSSRGDGGVLTASSTGTVSTSSYQDSYIIETRGNLSIDRVGIDPAVVAGTAYLTATIGGIFNGAASGQSNVIGGRTFLIAQKNIGTDLTPLFTRVGQIQSISTTGSTYVHNEGGLNVKSLDGTGLGQSSGGDIVTTASSPITVNTAIVSGGNVMITAVESAPEDYDVVTMNANVTADGSITILAGDHIVINSSSTLSAGGNLTMRTDVGDLGTGGGNLRVDGTVIAGGDIAYTTGGDEDRIVLSGTTTAAGGFTLDTGATRDFVDLTATGVIEAATIRFNLGSGDDQMTLRGTLRSGSTIVVDAGTGADSVLIEDMVAMQGHTTVLGGTGDDRLSVVRLTGQDRATDSLLLDGGAGSDDIFIQTHGSQTGSADYIIDAFDSGAPDAGADTMVISGTAQDDFFLSRANFMALMHGTNDQIRNNTADRPQTVERINYDRSINGRITALGLDGDDSFISDDNAAIMTLDGGAGNDAFQFGQIFGIEPVAGGVDENGLSNGIAAGDSIEAVLTTRGYLSNGVSFATIAFGGAGNDRFTVYANRAQLKLEGEAGNDDFIIRAFLLDTGEQMDQELTEVRAGDGDDNIQYNINSPVDIDGGAGFDTVIVLGTEGDDNFVVTENGIFGAGLAINISNTEEALEVDGLEGNDNFFILSTAAGAVTNVIGGLGSDTFTVTGDVTEQIVSLDNKGRSGLINHQIASTDDAYDETFVAGLGTNIADAVRGVVSIGQEASSDTTQGKTVVSETQGRRRDVYTVKLSEEVAVGAMVYVTVSAARSSTTDKALAVPVMAADARIGFAAGGTTLTRDSGSWIDDGFDIYQSLDLGGTGDSDGIYEIISLTDTAITVGRSFATTEAGLAGATVRGQQAESVLLSAGGGAFTDALVLTFDHTNWDQEQVVTVEAQDDAAKEGKRTVIVSHSVTSTDPIFDRADVENLEITVEDDDKAGVLIAESGTDTLLLEGAKGVTDSWDVSLTRAPDVGEVVTVTLTDGSNSGDLAYDKNVLSFTHLNWDQPQTVTATATADGLVENEERILVTHAVTSTGGAYAAVASEELRAVAVDGDSAGALVRETNGDTVIIDQTGKFDTYTVRLTKAPIADVTFNIFDDGQTRVVPDTGTDPRVTLTTLAQETVTVDFLHDTTQQTPDRIVRSGGSWAAAGFANGQTIDITGTGTGTDGNDGPLIIGSISEDGTTIFLSGGTRVVAQQDVSATLKAEAAQITFTDKNWNEEVTVKLEADPTYTPSADRYFTRVFAAEEHTTSKVYGPLVIDGGPTEARSLRTAVMLPTERDTGPLSIDDSTDETIQNDRVNIQNDGDVTGNPGFMSLTSDGVLVNGLDMGTGSIDFDVSDAQDGSEIVTYNQGITMRTVEIIDVLLGEGDDNFTISGTNVFSDNLVDLPVTAVHGGGGGDTITVTGGAGPDSLLVIYGDTDTYGARYDYSSGAPTGNGLVFDGFDRPEDHGDTIDARLLTSLDPAATGLTIYGGIGNDTIWGSSGSDQIAGGGGDDTIYGLDGNDHIYGDDGFITDLLTRELTVVSGSVTVPFRDSADTRLAGKDTIFGGAGDDFILGDHGIISQLPGTLRLADTGRVSRVESVQAHDGADDFIDGGLGTDLIIGGTGSDEITTLGGDNIVFGDNGLMDRISLDGDIGDIDELYSTYSNFGARDVITTGDGSDIIIGGAGADEITAGAGNNLISGDRATIRALSDLDAPQLAGIPMTLGFVTTTPPHADDAADIITAGTGSDLILGGGGGDTITANFGETSDLSDGDNLIVGDYGLAGWTAVEGVARLIAVASQNTDAGGDDRIFTGRGSDIVLGGFGADVINASHGDNIVLGDESGVQGSVVAGITLPAFDLSLEYVYSYISDFGGSDTILTGDGTDVIIGGNAGDTIDAGHGDNIVLGDLGYAHMTSGTPNFGTLPYVLHSVATIGAHLGGDDTIRTGTGSDLVVGGKGRDEIFASLGDSADTPDGQNIVAGDSIAAYWGAVADPDLATLGYVASAWSAGDGADRITTGSAADIVLGGGGGDTILAGEGANVVLGDSGELIAGAQAVNLPSFGMALQTVRTTQPGIGGNDTIRTGSATDIVVGGFGEDDIVAGDGANIVLGDNGELILDAGTPNFGDLPYVMVSVTTTFSQFGGIDTITTGTGSDLVVGGAGADVIVANNGESIDNRDAQNIVIGDGVVAEWDTDGDTATLDSVVSRWDQFDGGDTITTGTAADIVIGGGGSDTIGADEGANVVLGDSGELIAGATAVNLAAFSMALRTVRSTDTDKGGNDRITTGAATDVVLGGFGDDEIFAGDGANIVMGDSGALTLEAGTPNFGDLPYVLERVESLAPDHFGADTITTGVGADLVVGGSGGDTIVVNFGETAARPDAQNIVLGDNIVADWIADGDLATLDSITSSWTPFDGDDLIHSGSADDIVIGGGGNDEILASEGQNVVLGDSGTLVSGASSVNLPSFGMALREVRSTDTDKGGRDVITTGAATDVIFGGADNDLIDAGQGDNLVLGDSGLALVESGAPNVGNMPFGLLSVRTIDAIHGGVDQITTGLGDDVVLGGAAGDFIITDADDGSGARDGEDIVLGDHGIIDFVNPVTGSYGPLRDVLSTDVAEGGDDTIHSGASMDIVLGGAGGDVIDAGPIQNVRDIVFGDNGHVTFGGSAEFRAADLGDPTGQQYAIMGFNFGARGDDHHDDDHHDDKDGATHVHGTAGTGASASALPAPRASGWIDLEGGKGIFGDDATELMTDEAGALMPGVTIRWGAIDKRGRDDSARTDTNDALNEKYGLSSDERLFEGYLYGDDDDQIEVVLEGLSGQFEEYDIYVYLDGDKGVTDKSGAGLRRVTINGAETTLADPRGTDFDGSYRAANGTAVANYTVATGLSADKVTVLVDVPEGWTGKTRPVISGIQVVGRSYAIDVAESVAPDIGGNDFIKTGGGDDIVIGGAGNDVIDTAGDADVGHLDNDAVFGDNGRVTFVQRGTGATQFGELREMESIDAMQGFFFDDTILTGNGRDSVIGGEGSDLIDAGDRGPHNGVDDALSAGAFGALSINFASNLDEGEVLGRAGLVSDANWTNFDVDHDRHDDHHDDDDDDDRKGGKSGNDSHDHDGHSHYSGRDKTETLRTSDGVSIRIGSDLDGRKPYGLETEARDDLNPDTQSGRMMNGAIYAKSGRTLGVDVTDLGARFGTDSYDVYIYLNAQDARAARDGVVRLMQAGQPERNSDGFGNPGFAGEFLEYDPSDPSRAANVLVFRDVSGDAFSLRVDNGGSFDSRGRYRANGGDTLGIAGLQIVAGADRGDVVAQGDYDTDRVLGDQGRMRLFDDQVFEMVSAPGQIGSADDTIDGGVDGDVLIGGSGNDTIHAEAGDDIVTGDHARAILRNDMIVGLNGDGKGHDDDYDGKHFDPFGVPGLTLLYPELGGNDVIEGGQDDDWAWGGGGDDTYVFAGSDLGADRLVEADGHHGHDDDHGHGHDDDHGHGHDGHDTDVGLSNDGGDALDFSRFDGPVDIDLGRDGQQRVSGDKHDDARALLITLHSHDAFEDLVGSQYDDDLTGNDRNNAILGLAGKDRIDGVSGANFIDGGAGDDDLDAGSGKFDHHGHGHGHGDGHDDDHDRHDHKAPADNIVLGGSGDDRIRGGYGNDLIDGGEGDDRIDDNKGTNLIFGGAGNDYIKNGKYDTVVGGAGNDKLKKSKNATIIQGDMDSAARDAAIARAMAGFESAFARADFHTDANPGSDLRGKLGGFITSVGAPAEAQKMVRDLYHDARFGGAAMAARPGAQQIISAITDSEIVISIDANPARNSGTSSYVFNAASGEFELTSFDNADAPVDAVHTLLDADGSLFAYIDRLGGLWLLDDIAQNPGGTADNGPDDWLFIADY